MLRRARVAPGGLVYHVLNRSVAGLPLFRKEADYEAFERIMIDRQQRHPTRVLAWRWMRNHWHFVVWPQEDGELTAHFR
jgi:putative transposase